MKRRDGEIPVRRLRRMEKGKADPTAEEILRLARAFEVDPCWLAWGEGENRHVPPEGPERESVERIYLAGLED